MNSGTTTPSSTSSYWSLAIGGDGVVTGLDDIDQCVRTITATPLGSDLHRPDFGVDVTKYVDKPSNVMRPALVRELRRAILLWEPRITDVTVTLAGVAESGAVSVSLTWTPIADGSPQTTAITVPVMS